MIGRPTKGDKNRDNGSDELKEFVRILVSQLQDLMNKPTSDDKQQEEPAPKAVPGAPKKMKAISWTRKGLPRPFDPKPNARRCLFAEASVVESPIGKIPACPPRKSSRVLRSRIGERHHLFARRRLVFDDAMDQDENQQESLNSAAGAAPEEYSVLTLPNAPKKKRMQTPAMAEKEEETIDDACDNHTASPNNSSDDSIDISMELASNPNRWARLSTPASAPLPSLWESPKSSRRTRRRRSEGAHKDIRKCLMFD